MRYLHACERYGPTFAIGDGSFLKPAGDLKDGAGDRFMREVVFWVVVAIRTTVCVAGAPVTENNALGAGLI
jgi:hypothetical protein